MVMVFQVGNLLMGVYLDHLSYVTVLSGRCTSMSEEHAAPIFTFEPEDNGGLALSTSRWLVRTSDAWTHGYKPEAQNVNPLKI